ncbi:MULTISPECIES: hypothetical protein [unclassified Modicisalibacter]|uniref:hypothetical protein n=1 Tax=unclassified Modicisalibacter TaxID=2679913 RepID=UPI001CCF8EE3|nr:MULTISPECIES: hypothetical protein [unclassified Modicisalibacter]MBZ9559171.1 hypothetical protein [Modicisalibacter sp. R2A 31.J]MBZ9576664.1 hypothetical protein [Modicisalibacter sp. MOD 31.J]
MKQILIFLFWLLIAAVAIALTIVLGERGAWYFAWVLGTVMIVLIAAAGTAIIDARYEEHHDDQY